LVFYTFCMKTLLSYRTFAIIFLVMLVSLLLRIPLGTFNQNSLLDTVAHFVLPATGGPLLYAALRNAKVYQSSRGVGALVMIVTLGVTAEACWEVVEFVVDSLFGLHWQVDNTDTMHDLMSAFAGTIVGGFVFLKVYAGNLQARSQSD
jgi:hypothetical protein